MENMFTKTLFMLTRFYKRVDLFHSFAGSFMFGLTADSCVLITASQAVRYHRPGGPWKTL